MGGKIDLNPLYGAYKIIKDILKDREEEKSIKTMALRSDLTAVITELKRSHNTIIDVIHPIRELPNETENFQATFNEFYSEFKLYYDKEEFEDARSHCHNIGIIQKRLSRKIINRLVKTDRATDLNNKLNELSEADFEIIQSLKPWMDDINKSLEDIKTLVDQNKIEDAIEAKNNIVKDLSGQYNEWKGQLDEMRDTISEIMKTY